MSMVTFAPWLVFSAHTVPVGLGKSSLQVAAAIRCRLAACPRDGFTGVQGGPQAAVRPGGAAAQRGREGCGVARAAARERGPAPSDRRPGPLRAGGPILAGGTV